MPLSYLVVKGFEEIIITTHTVQYLRKCYDLRGINVLTQQHLDLEYVKHYYKISSLNKFLQATGSLITQLFRFQI